MLGNASLIWHFQPQKNEDVAVDVLITAALTRTGPTSRSGRRSTWTPRSRVRTW
jgi:hypothetical protein